MGLYNYKVDYAKSGWSGCRLCNTRIEQGSLRLANQTTALFWYHFECFFKVSYIFYDEEIENFENIKPEDQERLRERYESVEMKETDETVNLELSDELILESDDDDILEIKEFADCGAPREDQELFGKNSAAAVFDSSSPVKKQKKSTESEVSVSKKTEKIKSFISFALKYTKFDTECTKCKQIIVAGTAFVQQININYETKKEIKDDDNVIGFELKCFAHARLRSSWYFPFSGKDMRGFQNLLPDDQKKAKEILDWDECCDKFLESTF